MSEAGVFVGVLLMGVLLTAIGTFVIRRPGTQLSHWNTAGEATDGSRSATRAYGILMVGVGIPGVLVGGIGLLSGTL